jgi:hypothetical protein
MLRQVAFLSLVLAVYGCSSSLGPEEAPATTPAAAASGAIAKIVTRDRSITLHAGGGTVRVTVLDENGKLIARDVPVDDLQYIDASAYDACHASFAERRGEVDRGEPFVPR